MKEGSADQTAPRAPADSPAGDRDLIVRSAPDELPPILGHLTPQVRARTESFYAGSAELFERWVARRPSPQTQRAHRRDVLSFIDFLGVRWPASAAPKWMPKVVRCANSLHHLNRQHVTVAHEIGHLLLHEGNEMQVHVDKGFRMNLRNEASSKATDRDEVEANLFASELLMPEDMLLPDLDGSTIDIEDDYGLRLMADRYGVSPQAMASGLTESCPSSDDGSESKGLPKWESWSKECP